MNVVKVNFKSIKQKKSEALKRKERNEKLMVTIIHFSIFTILISCVVVIAAILALALSSPLG